MEFFESPNHLAYWGFSLAIGILQEIGTASSFGMLKHSVILIEHLVRTNILLATYWIFEVSQEFGGTATVAQYLSFQAFFADRSHQYIAIVLCLLGLVIGFAHMIAANYLNMLQRTASRLGNYSERF